ncbi:MAG: peptidoglycan DD-metalloendopeptidase family protein [Oscillospiraceae bacterium]|nr:peptidoglycan DD-metalloendopeptidase family protein [Oscillospiraceae bacterium]
MTQKISRRIIAFITLLALLLALFPLQVGASSSSATQEDIDAAKAERDRLQQELNEINTRLSEIKDEVEKAEEKANTYSQRVSLVSSQIGALQESITLKTEQLTLKQEELELKKETREATYALFKQRLRSMYMNNQASTLSTLLGANTLTEFLVGAESISRISQHDTELVEQLAREEAEIKEAEELIQQELDSLEADKTSLEGKYSELAQLLQEANSELSTAEALQEVTEEDYEQILADFEEADNYLDSLMGTGSENYVGGYYAWPVPGFTRISSGFGWRTLYGKTNYHGGIDIAGSGIYGAPIIASNDGTVKVAYAGWTGYGHYVMIDHGGNNWTVYGHMSRIAVSVGQYVKQGETIGYVGSTGNSTGPHLHFEIRINGTKVNPINYVSR